MIKVFKEDFSTMQVGAFPYDYTPLGEYHLKIPEGFTGKWSLSSNHPSWRRKECSTWNILVEGRGKRKVLEQATVQQEGLPTIKAGDGDWQDYELSCSFKPLSLQGPVAVLFRYQNSRQYYACWFAGQAVQLIMRDDREFKVLREVDCQLSCDQYYTVKILTRGDYLRVLLADRELVVRDKRYTKGKIALAANAPVRYDWVEVCMEAERYQLFIKKKRQKKEKLAKERAGLPRPVLWRRLETPGFGVGKSIRFGDLDGDGQLEILLAQNVRRMSKDSFPEISCLTALDLEGNILWQLGEPNPANALVTNDLPFQIHDIDGDGQQEVILCKDFKLQVLEGKTGSLKYQVPTPINPAKYDGGEGFYRVNGDALYYCDLRGNGADRDIIFKDRYSNLWAYTWDFKLLWQQTANVGHYPMAYDLDGDGCDELLIGYNLFDQDGSLLWSLDLTDHADGVAVGKFGKNDELKVIIAASDEGIIWLSAAGEIKRHHYPGHCQTVTVANLIPEREGLEMATITFWGNPGIVIIYDEEGSELCRRELINPWGSALSPVNWSGTGQEHILLSTHPRLGGMIDGCGRRVVSFPADGHPYLCCEVIDLIGDSRDEIITWDTDSIWIYTQDSPVLNSKVYTPVRQPHYNMSNYRAQISLADK